MKQLKLLACFVMLTTYVHAQYFQAKYTQDPTLGGTGINGMRTHYTSDGHLLGGLKAVEVQPPPPCPLGAFHWGLMVTRTDPAGGFTSPANFNNTYLFQDGLGNEIRLSGGQVLEYRDGTGYAAIFSYYLYIPPPFPCTAPYLTSQGVAFVRLDALGNVTKVSGFPMPSNGYHTYVHDIRESRYANGDVYATGEWNSVNYGSAFWALRVTNSGALVWGNVYSNAGEMSYGIIDSPHGDNEAIVVGSSPVPGTSGTAGLWMSLNATTGVPNFVNNIHGGNTSYFRSINQSVEPGNPGFILSGYNDGTAWLTKTDNSGTPQWSSKYLPTVHSSTYITATDAKGRFNSQGNYEYYATGPCSNDAFIFKVNQSGTPLNPNALFFYDTGTKETPQRLDINTSGTYDGVSIYGVVEAIPPSTQKEGYIVKAYFNGVTACNGSLEDLQNASNPWIVTPSTINTTPLLTQDLSLLSVSNNLNLLLCNASSIPSGDNARTALATGITTQNKIAGDFNLFPNPCNTSLKPLTATVSSANGGIAKVTITNLLGQVVYSQNSQLQPGANILELDLTGTALNNGVYQLSILTSTGTQLTKFIADNTR